MTAKHRVVKFQIRLRKGQVTMEGNSVTKGEGLLRRAKIRGGTAKRLSTMPNRSCSTVLWIASFDNSLCSCVCFFWCYFPPLIWRRHLFCECFLLKSIPSTPLNGSLRNFNTWGVSVDNRTLRRHFWVLASKQLRLKRYLFSTTSQLSGNLESHAAILSVICTKR